MTDLTTRIERLLAVTESLLNSDSHFTPVIQNIASNPSDIIPSINLPSPENSQNVLKEAEVATPSAIALDEDHTMESEDPTHQRSSQTSTTPIQLGTTDPSTNFASESTHRLNTPRLNTPEPSARPREKISTPRSGRIKFNKRENRNPVKPLTDSEKQELELLGQAMQSFIYYLAQQNQKKSPSLPRPTTEELRSLKPLKPIDNLLQGNSYTLDEYSSLPANSPKILSPEEVKGIGFVEEDEKKTPYLDIISRNLPTPFNLHAHCQNRARQYAVATFSWADQSDNNHELWNLRMAAFCVDTFITACEQQCFPLVHAHQLKIPAPPVALEIFTAKLKHRIKTRNREENHPGSILKNQQIDRRYRRRQALQARRKDTCQIVKQLNAALFLFDNDYICSDDESDDQDRKSRTRISLPFRSKSATALVEHIDQISEALSKKDETRRPGPPPATRKPSNVTPDSPNLRIPVGLPRDVYDESFLSTLTSTQMDELKAKDDFFTSEVTLCIYKPLPI
ncbi:hypothetical protein PGT21_001737 [Puccinia graminis f. sp. tritici]|uniref:Uncharacterized protein n=1 Tax=Puccinia graminis f. sp. tritici TaxID=56615 RepID=A0A5B0Q9D8_PUCGR|nr:hypothetical protein PGT21_001737 [Puccinia graminis f. sp. tritici]